jgi:hypothetical protein
LVLARFWHRDGYIFVADRASPRNASVTIGPTGVAASDGRTQMMRTDFFGTVGRLSGERRCFHPHPIAGTKAPPRNERKAHASGTGLQHRSTCRASPLRTRTWS